MNCELCGKEVAKTKTVNIEGSEINVCPECAKYGKEVFSTSSTTDTTNEILKRIEKKRRRSSKGLGDKGEKTLAFDYSDRIKDGRLDNDWDQEELADRVHEKKSVIAKLERGDMRPSDELRKKLEHTLDIELQEKIEPTKIKSNNDSGGLTIGDLIKEKS
ncbi:MAG: multiprotein bridging factor aMBF1 [Thermoplasmata archaeon]